MADSTELPCRIDVLAPVRRWLNALEIHNVTFAKWLCKIIPTKCYFERNIKLWGDAFIIRIPPLCKLNPLYEEIVLLRFHALSYLADECGLDITTYL